MTKILAISAKKQGGKTTSTNFLFGLEMLSLNLISYFRMSDEGKLIVPSQMEDGTIQDAIFDPLDVNEKTYGYLATNIWPTVKQYNFADPLKKGICMGILGLTNEQCYGTDDEKNQPTYLKWENMPGVTTNKTPQNVVEKEVAGRLGKYYEKILNGMIYHAPGNMTGREVMQFLGTEIFRKIYDDVWVDALIRQIKAESPQLALIGDCRFPNEVFGTQKAGGKVIRFTKNNDSEDKHYSETALDKENFDWNKFDYVLDNEKMSIDEQNNELYRILADMGILSYSLEFKDGVYGAN